MTGNQPARGRTSAASTSGSFAPKQHGAPGPAASLGPSAPRVPTPPDIGVDLVQPVTCRKCNGDGSYAYIRGGLGACAPCGGTGLVEGDRAAKAARKARQEATIALYNAARDHSYETAEAVNMLRQDEPERYEKALGAFLNADPRLMDALAAYADERRLARSPRERALRAIKAWTPPTAGLDTREGAFDQCKHTSAAFTAHMRSLGFEADWVQVSGMKRECPDAHPKWAEMDPSRWSHYVTRVRIPSTNDPEDEGKTSVEYVDWTLRQFDPRAAYPYIGGDRIMRAFFEEMHEIPDSALDRHLAERR